MDSSQDMFMDTETISASIENIHLNSQNSESDCMSEGASDENKLLVNNKLECDISDIGLPCAVSSSVNAISSIRTDNIQASVVRDIESSSTFSSAISDKSKSSESEHPCSDNFQEGAVGRVGRPHSPDDKSTHKKIKKDHLPHFSSTSVASDNTAASAIPSSKNNKRPFEEEEISSSSHPRSSRPRLSSESLADDHQAVEALEAAPQQQAHDQPDMAPSSDKLQKMSHKSMSSLSSSNGDGSRNVGVALSSLPRITVSAPSAPPVVPGSPHHTVMVRVSGRAATQEQKQNVPPRPYPAVFRDVWDSHHVRMPCSPASFHVVDTLENTTSPRWTAIKQALSNPMRSVEEMERAVLYYNKRYSNRWHFKGLRKLIHEDFTEMERDHFLDVTLPAMCTLALRLPDLVTQPPPLLKAHYGHSITLSQLQISCLLANAFFCTFPRRNATGAETEYALYPDINFNRLLSNKLPRAIEKIKCIINYFRRVTTKEPTGVVTVVRQQVDNTDAVTWQQCSSQFTRLHCDDRGYIDDATGLLQVDFANRFLGGGVLGLGCVQEEIRFVICPELLITRLFTESLDKTEAIIVIGVEQYNKSTGYSDTFKFDGNHQDTTDSDAYGRKLSQLVAIDAVRFSRRAQLQYQETLIIRELNKAYAGFCPLDGSEGRPVAVATGNWGCGAFKGDPKLKALIQLSVCGYAERDVAYYTFKDSHLRNNIVDMHQFLLQNNITVGTLVQCLCQYGQLEREVDGSDLFNYVYHSLSSKVSSPDSSPGNSPRPSGAGHGAGSGGGGGGGTTQQDQTQKYKQNQHRDDSNQQHSRENRGNQQRSHINKEQHHQRSREEGKQNGRSQKWRPEHKQQNKQQMTSKQNQQQVQQQQNTVNRKSGANSTSDDWRAQSRNMNNGFSGSKKQVKRPNNNKITKYFSSVTKQAGNEPNRNNNNSRSNSCQKSDRNNLTEDEIVAHIVNYDEHHNASAAGATASAAGANASAGDASTGGVSDASSAGGFSYSAMARKKPNDKND
uniref:poly(ADP-ribose) glycohydrolase n=2 Tax=Hirondellea gigas TaxID=1518452 RepID=A0A6A7FZG1_9CRUS